MLNPVRLRGWLLLPTLLLAALVGFGQQITGTLTGTVLDSTGATIPNANITVRNVQSGDVRRSVTNQEGYFAIAAVPAGNYVVSIEAPGFTKQERTGVVFNPGDKRNLDIQLEVARADQQVQVVATTETITPVDSGEKASVITTQQLQNIPVTGRSAAEFVRLLPGMAPTGAGLTNRAGFSGEVIGINGNGDGGKQSALGTFAANGLRPEAVDITADGAHVSDPGCNCATPVNPNVDMLQEFKVYQSNFAAENAKGPVVFTSVTKSGGRDFHGMGYFYARHFALNSNDAEFKGSGQPRPENRFFFPGGNIGGPVLIPGTGFNRNRDKLFFFTGYEYYAQRLDTGILRSQVPTDAMLRGDFREQNVLNAFGNASGQANAVPNAAVNGVIPQSLIDPGGQALLRLLPRPNADPAGAGAGYNYVQALSLNQNMWQSTSKVDWNVSDYTKLFVRYQRQNELQSFPVQLWWRNGNAVPLPTDIQGKNRSDAISVGLTNVFNPTLTNEFVFGYTFVDFPNSYADISALDRQSVGYPYRGIFKQDNKVPAFVNWGGGTPSLYTTGGFDPILFATKHLYSITDNLTKVVGTHTMKFGGFYGSVSNAQPGNAPSNGEIVYANWATNTTGNALADLLLGRLAGYTESTQNINRDMRFQDIAVYGQDSWKVTPRFTLEYGMRFQHLTPWTARNGIGMAAWVPGQYSNDPARLGDLTGLRWNAIDDSIPLGGFASKGLHFAPRLGFAWDVRGTGSTVVRGGAGKFVYAAPQLAAAAMDVPAGFRSTSLSGEINLRDIDRVVPSTVRTGATAVDPEDDSQPTTYSYSLTVSQRLPSRMLFEAAYVGNRSTNLPSGDLSNVNLVPYGAMFGDPNADANNFRPLRNYLDVNVTRYNTYSNYNALQTSLAKQAGRLNFTLAYTWSKAMGIRQGGGQGSVPDLLNRDNNYGPLGFDRTHLFSASYVFELPRLSQQNALLRTAAGGWQLSGITQVTSGVNIQANTSPNFNLNAPRPDIPDQTIGATYVNGTPAIQAMPRIICDPRSGLRDAQFMNGACFAPPAQGQNGSLIFPYMRGPAFVNSDLALFKNFDFTESQRLQFRAQAANFLNYANRSFVGGDPGLNLTFNAAGQLANPNFGFARNRVGRRVIMLGVKYYF